MVRICIGDLEANGLLDTVTEVHCGVFKDIRTNEVHKKVGAREITSFMSTIDVLIMHNGVNYDLPMLEKVCGYTYPGKIVDTLLMSRLLFPDRQQHSVESWGKMFGRHKPEHEDWSVFSPEMLHRCTEDVEIQHRIYDECMRSPHVSSWRDGFRLTHKVFEILGKQEEYGWLVDREYMDRCLFFLNKWIDKIKDAVQPSLPVITIREKKTKGVYSYVKEPFKMDGSYIKRVEEYTSSSGMDAHGHVVVGPFSRIDTRPVDLDKRVEVIDYLLGQGWVPQAWNEDKEGNRTSPKLTKDDPFKGVEGKVGRLVAKRQVCKHRRGLIEGLIKIIRPDGRISQRITGIATTGRLKHSGIVNIPGGEKFFGKQCRKIFIAKPGYKIVGVDSAGCQNRMLAARVGDPAFTKTLLEGKKEDKTSIHFVNMAAITKVAGFTPSYGTAKNLNYAFIFGSGDPKLASIAVKPKTYGPKIRKAMLSVSPGLEGLVESLQKEWADNGGYITGVDGRMIHISSEHKLLVFLLQSDEAVLMQVALCYLYEWLTRAGWVHGREYGFVANVHDEIQAEVREDLVPVYSELAEAAIVKAGEFLNIQCPHKGEADSGNSWYETH